MNLLGSPYLLGGVALLAFSAGWSVNGWRHDAALNSAADKVRAEEQIKLDTLQSSLNRANSERLSLAADLAVEKTKLKTNYRAISQEVPIHVPQNTDDCPSALSPGLVGLLNTAARGGSRYANSAPKPSGQHVDPVPGAFADLAD